MGKLCKTFLSDDSGATAIEYGLIAALVSIAALVTLTSLGSSLGILFGEVETQVTDATTSL